MTRRIVHVITGLGVGGAETMLYKLLTKCDRSEFEPEVVSLGPLGPLAERIRSLGIPVSSANIEGPMSAISGVIRIAGQLKAPRADIVQTWMYHADLIGGLAARLAGVPVAWGIRQSHFDESGKNTTKMTAWLCARLSTHIPHAIIACSDKAARVHASLGYRGQIEVIPNGFDLESFTANRQAGISLKQELGISHEKLLIGHVARFDRQKDHRNFVRAAGIVAERIPHAHFVLCGPGVTNENVELMGWIGETSSPHRFHLLGCRDDMPRVTAALDVAVSSSSSEGFSNTVGEAMACEVPCVVTNVGDSADMVGDTGEVVPPGNPEALAAAIATLISLAPEERMQLGAAARRRIASRYELREVVRRYEKRYEDIIERCAA